MNENEWRNEGQTQPQDDKPYWAKVSFSSCQRTLIKTFQIEAMIVLISKVALIFFMRLVKWLKIAVKKANFFRTFRNINRSILTLEKIGKKQNMCS